MHSCYSFYDLSTALHDQRTVPSAPAHVPGPWGRLHNVLRTCGQMYVMYHHCPLVLRLASSRSTLCALRSPGPEDLTAVWVWRSDAWLRVIHLDIHSPHQSPPDTGLCYILVHITLYTSIDYRV